MNLKRCSFSSSDSSSSSAMSEDFSSAADRVVTIELEAAEALADLAHLAVRENGSGDSSGKWGSKGKQGKKRVNSESPSDDSVLNPVVELVPTFSDHAPQDQVIPNKHHGEPFCRNVEINPAKIELVADISKPSFSSVQSHPPLGGGGRSRQNLTEDEKEARRLRRILANRESARQTIRRRQALCEELTRKSVDLAWEHESLKREKELALKEYQSLESKNKHLKAQMAKLIKTEAEDSRGDPKSAPVEKSTSTAANCPLLLYNQRPFSPLCWPPTQSSNPLQSNHGPQNAFVVPSNISMPPNGKFDSSQQHNENPAIVHGPRTPLYIVSCPWFFPVPGHGNGLQLQPSFGLKSLQEQMSVNNEYSRSSSTKVTALMENQLSSLPEKVKSEVTIVTDLNETPVGFPPDGGGQCEGHHSKESVIAPVTLGFVKPTAAIKNESGTRSEFVPYTDGICSKSRQLMNALSVENKDPYKFPSKKIVNPAAAAEARRRRKEFTKLKNLHGRQCRNELLNP